MSKTIRHIWFDFAGTLYRETPEFKQAYDQYKYKVYADLTGTTDIKKVKQEFDELVRKNHSVSAVFTALGQPSDFWQNAFNKFDIEPLLRPNVHMNRVLAELKGMVPISLFTNLKRDKIGELLEHLEIPELLFTHILSGDDVAARKPALDGFYKIIELSGLPADQILYVGDRVEAEIIPAKTVGLKTCLVYSESDEADYCVKSFEELIPLVKP